MQSISRVRLWFAAILFVFAAMFGSLAMGGSRVAASTYGHGDYSDCKYQTDCPSSGKTNPPVPDTPAPAPPPSAPKIIVVSNIDDDQVISTPKTEIVITHLERVNPDGSKTIIPSGDIGWVAFYVENKLVVTQYSVDAADGQFHIPWDVAKYPGTHISLVFYDHLGNVIQRLDKIVKLASSLLTGPLSAQTSPAAKKRFVLTPKEEAILKSIPYWVLLILLAIALRLWIQSVREIRAANTIKAIIRRERDIFQQKQNFVSLVSHYLRTPLTALQGGIELLGLPVNNPLSAAYSSMSSAAEALITKVDATTTNAIVVSGDAQILERRPLFTLRFWALIGSFVLISALFEGLARLLTTISYSWFDIFVELFSGIAVIVFMLLGVRQSQIKRSVREHEAHNLELQHNLDAARNQFISETATSLRGVLAQLEAAGKPFQQDKVAGKFVAHGIDELAQVIVRLTVAAQISAEAVTSLQSASVDLGTLISHTTTDKQDQIEAKHLHIQTPRTTFSLLTNSALLAFVVESVVENAIKFNTDNGTVDISAVQEANGTTITVHDTGVGIPEQKLQELLQPFSRAVDATDFSQDGMGFDLYLCKIIMQRLDGSVNLSSKPDQGTTCKVTIPLQPH